MAGMRERPQAVNVSVGDLIDRLSIVNLKVAFLEADLRAGKEAELGLEEVGRRAIQIRNLNRERIALKNALNERLDPESFPEVKVNHASETPRASRY